MAGKKTLEQRIAEKEQELRRLKAQARAADRKARTHRLVASAAKIEADAGIELDELWATAIARAIASGAVVDPHASAEANPWTR